MSAVEVVAAVLRQHRIERCTVSTPEYSHQWGRCAGCDFESEYVPIKGVNWDELQADISATHVAAEVVRALGLAEEWTWSWPNGSAQGVPGFGFSVATRAEAEDEGGEYTIVSRQVTPWSEGTP